MTSKVYSDFGILKPVSYLSNKMLSNLFYSLDNITFDHFIENMFNSMKHIPYEYINVGFDISKGSTKYIHQGFFNKTSRGYAVYNFAFSDTNTDNDEINIDMDITKPKINIVEKGNYIIVGIKNSKQYLWQCNTLILVYKVENIRDDENFRKHIAQSVLVNISMTHQFQQISPVTKPLSEVYFNTDIDRVDIEKDYKIMRINKVIEPMIKKFNEMNMKVSN